MAVRLINISKSLQRLTLASKPNYAAALVENVTDKPRTDVNFNCQCRNTTNFFNKLPADALWKGITSVSNAGKKRGRGKTVSKKLIKDLNKGQVIGVGKANILWPGLSTPIIRGKELVEQQKLPEDPEREKKLIELRDKMGKFSHVKLSPIERGWSGAKLPGRSVGPPDPVGEDTFEGFDTKVLELKTVFNMKGNLGRRRRQACMVVVGNSQGLAGFATAKAPDGKSVLRKAKNKAAQKLIHVDIFRGHTIHHDFFSQFGATKMYVSQRPEGYGLVCHRAIRTCCETIGIKDIYAKVEGSTNVNHIVKAFFLGLLRQKTHKKIAEEKRLHLVEMCKENGYFPKVLASPEKPRTKEEIDKDEVLDFTQYCFDGKVIYKKKKFPPFYTKHKSWEIYLRKQEYVRNQDKVQLQLRAEYGEVASHLTEKYPESRHTRPQPRDKKEEAAEEQAQEA